MISKLESFRYNLVRKVKEAEVFGTAYIRNESKIRFVTEGAGIANVVRIEARIKGQSNWDLLLEILGTDNQIIDVSNYEEIQVSIIVFQSTDTFITVIGSSFDNVSASGAVVNDFITNGNTTSAPSENAVFDALALKASTANVSALITLSGVAADSTHLGTFTGSIIPDSSNDKQALQSIETFIEALPSPMLYKGLWVASTNTPMLADGIGSNGDVYQVTDTGSVNFGSGSISFTAGDKVVYDGAVSKWEKWDMTDAVASVNGQIGLVTLNTGDISEGSNLYFTNTRAQTATITQVITNGVIDKAPSEDAVFDALALKQNTGNYITALTGEVTATGPGSVSATVANSAVIAKVLTGYVSGAGTVSSSDSILTAIQKLNGNNATNANLTGPITSVGNVTSVASQTGTGSTFVMNASPTITTPTFSGTAIGSISGNAATVTTNANLTGDVTSVGNATTLTNAPVIAKVLTGYVSGAGVVSSSDSILSAIQKLNGNTPIILTASASLDFPSIATNASSDLTISVTGAVVGDCVSLGRPSNQDVGLVTDAFVSATNVVTVRAHNYTGASINQGARTYKVKVIQ